MTIGTILFIAGLAVFGAATSLGAMALLPWIARLRKPTTAVEEAPVAVPKPTPPQTDAVLEALKDMRGSISELAQIQMSVMSDREEAEDQRPGEDLDAAINKVNEAIASGFSKLSDELGEKPTPPETDPEPFIAAMTSQIAPLSERLDLLSEAATVTLQERPEGAAEPADLDDAFEKQAEALSERMAAISAASTERVLLTLKQRNELSEEQLTSLSDLGNQPPLQEIMTKSEQVLTAAMDAMSEKIAAKFDALEASGSAQLEQDVRVISARLVGIEERLERLAEKPAETEEPVGPAAPSELDLRLSALLERLETKIANDTAEDAETPEDPAAPIMSLVEPPKPEARPATPPKPIGPSSEFELLRAYPGLAAMLSRSSEHSRTS
ncbi:MAG: hypothetical protein AAGF22_00335 [Pseudomonadota bacterium]